MLLVLGNDAKELLRKFLDVLSYSNSLQDVLDTTLGTAGYNVLPHVIFDVLFLVQYTPIRAVFCL